MSNTYNALIHAKQDGTGEEVANNKTGGDGSLYAPVTSIATPENGDTASKAYAVGEMFIRGDKLCTCIVAISSGDALVKDTNYKEGSVGEVLTELNNALDGSLKIYLLYLRGITVTANSPYTVNNVSSQIGIDKTRIKGAFIGFASVSASFDKNVSSVTWGGYYDFLAFTPSLGGEYDIGLNIVYI